MIYQEICFIFLYVSAFGLNDYFIENMEVTGNKQLFYYFIILSIGVVGLKMIKHETS